MVLVVVLRLHPWVEDGDYGYVPPPAHGYSLQLVAMSPESFPIADGGEEVYGSMAHGPSYSAERVSTRSLWQ